MSILTKPILPLTMETSQTDLQLITKLQQGDDDALINYLQRLSHQLSLMAYGYLKNDADVEDAISEMTIVVYKKRKQVKDPAVFKTWVISILINKCRDLLRKRQQWIQIDDDDSVVFEDDETFDFVYDYINDLNVRHREVVLLKTVQELTFAEMAHLLNEPEGTLKKRYYTALRVLRQKMEDLYA